MEHLLISNNEDFEEKYQYLFNDFLIDLENIFISKTNKINIISDSDTDYSSSSDFNKNNLNLIELKKLPKICINFLNKNITEKNYKDILLKEYEKLKIKWHFKNNNSLNSLNILQIILRNFNIKNNCLNSELIKAGYTNCLYEVLTLKHKFKDYNLLNMEDATCEYYNTFTQILEIITHFEKILSLLILSKRSLHPNYESIINEQQMAYNYSPPDFSKNSSYQNLLLYLLNTLNKKQLRRYPPNTSIDSNEERYCYRPRYLSNGFFTHSWVRECSIEQFIHRVTTKEVNWKQWHNLTADKTNGKNAVLYLSKTNDLQFQNLIKSRNVLSFNNGIYITSKWDEKQNKYVDEFIKYGTKEQKKLSSNIVSAKFFDLEFSNFDDIEDWYNIPTPHIQSILDYQFKDEDEYVEICRWLYIFMGRMFYDLGQLDDWQVIGFVKGLAGTGKGTLLTKIIKKFYEPDDVGILSNDGEKTFGLSGFHDKLLFIAPEIKGDISLPQAVFQSMVSGEDLVVSVKFKNPKNMVWTTPGFLAGNEVPNYKDNSGSLSRRLVIWAFMKKVTSDKSDPLLGKKLNLELSKIIKKSNIAYLNAIEKFGKKNIWNNLPNYFIRNQNDLAQQTNTLMNFLLSGKIKYDKDTYVRESVFKTHYTLFCKSNNIKPSKYNVDLYAQPFAVCGERFKVQVNVLKNKKKKYPPNTGRYFHGTFITGIDIIIDDDDDDEEDFMCTTKRGRPPNISI